MSLTAQVRFELEQFEVIGGDRCEVHGCWFGVRGRRFLRPVLTFKVDGRSMRVLADLAGKPWAAEDGRPWHASFPGAVAGTQLVGAELSVAPDLTVALRSPRPPRSVPAPAPGQAPHGPAPYATDESEARATPSPFERRSRADPDERLRRELVDARTEQQRLQNHVDHLTLKKSEMAKRISELIEQAGAVRRELDTVTRAREQLAAKLEAAAADRDEALFRLDAMTAKRDAARYDYTELVRKLEATEAAHRQTPADRGRAIAGADRPSRSAHLHAVRDPAPIPLRATGLRPGSRGYPQLLRQAGPAVMLLVITLLVALIMLRA